MTWILIMEEDMEGMILIQRIMILNQDKNMDEHPPQDFKKKNDLKLNVKIYKKTEY